ncbi:3'-5' exonuclease family protein [Trichomonas vaginalis G3]|uniref:3'-5' exonuclease family protein n=1 Tax=Trichomonas vaginalis (strain ATCC PRA-98 / G3) TaxID=412133 RepID=A2F154_TRIV3|nr:3'-5' exonuclease protein [Trichomonas vaginalis G3]EAY01345.1 3'-5' exonuclease family protein [Trichomonas vaginalis G3]KAI5516696.1 3'-5' exonuclease protein [Trichomonas vaginalis G3]|eukprot:XP_001330198.1 3'-5' exonuclease family protein [Trichomonas vaginalis G3]
MKYCGSIRINDNFYLPALRRNDWDIGEMRKVMFFKGRVSLIYLTSVDHPEFKEHLKLIDIDDPICIDFEWRVSYSSKFQNHISLFQFATDNCALLIRHLPPQPSEILKEFLETHSFIGKSTGNDMRKLKDLFGTDINVKIEDIASNRLCPHGFSRNFHDMVATFVGPPLFSIKDKTVTLSNWERPKLAIIQVLYAAFDVIALSFSLPRLPPAAEPKQKVLKGNRAISKSQRKRIFKNPGECAKALSDITFPNSVLILENIDFNVPDITTEKALKLTLELFNMDESIPSTMTIEVDEDLPSELFETQNWETQQESFRQKEEPDQKFLSSSEDDYDYLANIGDE